MQPVTPARFKDLMTAYWGWVKPLQKWLWLGLGMMVLTNVSGAFIPFFIERLLADLQRPDLNIQQWLTADFLRLAGLLTGLAIFQFIGRVGSRYGLLGLARRVEVAYRNQLAGSLLFTSPLNLKAYNVGDLISRLTNDLTSIRYLIGGGSMLSSNTLLAYATRIPLMLILDWRLTLVTLAVYPFMLVGMIKLSGRLKRRFLAVQEALGRLSQLTHQIVTRWLSIQANGQQANELTRVREEGETYLKASYSVVQDRTLLSLLMLVLSGLSLVLLLGVGAPLIQSGQLSISTLIAFALYLEQLTWPTLSLGWMTSMVQQAFSALERTRNLATLDEEPTQKPEGGAKPSSLGRSSEELDEYSGEDRGLPVSAHQIQLWDGGQPLSFECLAGSLTVIQGPVGSGKSLLLKSLAGFHRPAGGHLLINNREVNRENTANLRQQLVYVPQQPFVMSQTVKTLLKQGLPEGKAISDDSLEAALHSVGLLDEVKQWPEGLDTFIGPKGQFISGGQRQRLLLAQALLTQRPLWLLDDPFSSVDGPNEQRLLEAIRRLHDSQRPTLLISSHRPSIQPYADQILTLESALAQSA